MYQKHSSGDTFNFIRSKRFSTFVVLLLMLGAGTIGAYMTVVGPRLRAVDEQSGDIQPSSLDLDAEELVLVEQTGENEVADTDDEDVTEQEPDTANTEVSAPDNVPSGDDASIDANDSGTPNPAQPPQEEAVQTPPTSTYTASWATNSLAGRSFYLGSHNPAAATADAWRTSRPADAAYMDTVAAPAKGIWLVMGISNISSYVSSNTAAAVAQEKLPIFVLYGMPSAGCGGVGSAAANNYLSWVDKIDAAISGDVVIIVEPDELPLDQCGGSAETGREQILKSAVSALAGPGRYMYIDAGHGSWVNASTMKQRLERVGVEMTQGFSLNVSNYTTTAVNTAYGNNLSALLGGAHFVIDTSRNGIGPDPTYEWCNAPDRALGELPQTYGAGSKLNATMWVKYPGESDGSCNGGPGEGQWWAEYALDLAQNAE